MNIKSKQIQIVMDYNISDKFQDLLQTYFQTIQKINGHQFCVVDKEEHKHSKAVEICNNLNARLPLPRDKAEAHAFMSLKGFTSGKFYNVWMNADARNPIKTSNKSEWVDAEGKPLGNRAVYLRVIILFLLF